MITTIAVSGKGGSGKTTLAALIIRYVSVSQALILLLQCIGILFLVTILERAGNIRERRRDIKSSSQK